MTAAALEVRPRTTGGAGSLLLGPELAPDRVPFLGGKGRSLHLLSKHGIPVPKWWCVSAAAYSQVRELVRKELEEQLDGVDFGLQATVEGASRAIQSVFLRVALPPDLEELLEEVLPDLLQRSRRWAVRSSAMEEDSARASFAGQLDTFLHVPSRGVGRCIRLCWASAFTPRMLRYLEAQGRSPLETRVAVLIQEMVESRGAGIMFTADPRGRLDDVVIVAGLGLGEGVVTDRVGTDTYVYDRSRDTVRRTVAEKSLHVVFDREAGSGTTILPTPPELRTQPVLSEAQIRALVALGERLETLCEHPQDVEWAIDRAGSLAILQSRPITTIPRGEPSIFDNSNVVESYPGVSSPLTFSFIKRAYERVFENAMRRMGVRERRLADHRIVFRNMLAYIEGRVYYNLSSWYRMLRLLPGASLLIPAWQRALGVKIRSGVAQEDDRSGGVSPRLERLAMVARILFHWMTLDRSMRALRARFERRHRAFRELDLASLHNHELVRLYTRVVDDLLDGWEITIVNDFFAIGFSSLARSRIERISALAGQGLFNDLLCGESGMESVEPVREAVRLAERVRADSELERRVRDVLDAPAGGVDAAWARLRRGVGGAAFARALEAYLDRYGDRAFGELKLEAAGFRADPRPLLGMILGYGDAGLGVEAMERREGRIRKHAEEALCGALRRHPLERALVSFALRHARRSIVHREASRLDRARAFDIPRTIFRQLGRNLAEEGALASSDDVFFLTLDEIFDYVQGGSVDPGLAGLVEVRRRRMDSYTERRPAERILTRGTVYGNRIPQRSGPPPESRDAASVLEGSGCAPGVVTGRALVVRDPAQAMDVRGKVLIAEMTDPGWVFLMIAAAGLVVEKGSVLSHTAIIGRELGIVTVVGVEGATERIPNGAWLRVDGETGRISVLPGHEQPEQIPMVAPA